MCVIAVAMCLSYTEEKGEMKMAFHFEEYFLSTGLGDELQLLYCGYENCTPLHKYGPSMRDHYVVHYIVSGQGTVISQGSQYRIAAGSYFCMFPNVPCTYQADQQQPWSYYWIGLRGKEAGKLLELSGLSSNLPTSSCPVDQDKMEKLYAQLLASAKQRDAASEWNSTGIALQLLAGFVHSASSFKGAIPRTGTCTKETYIERAIAFIEREYQGRLTVSAIAAHVGLERSYFSKLFQRYMGVPPSEFLLRVRMEKAALLLSQSDLSVQNIAARVGFNDAANFSKAFARYLGQTPSVFRKYSWKVSNKSG